MLVIRRRAGESFRLGDDIEIQILETSGGQIKIGISAPRDIAVLRTEVWLTAKQNQKAASAAVTQLTEEIVRQFFKPDANSPQAPGDYPDKG